MQPMYLTWVGLIDVTYHCGRECVYCTRCDRHLGYKRFHMDLNDFETAVISYDDWPTQIGIIGGEPLYHPKFSEICNMLLGHSAKGRNVLFTSVDSKKSKWEKDINKTFGTICYHPHTDEQEATYKHQPLTIAIKDVVKDEVLRDALIDDCWVQRKWCPTITDDGAFFCEVGASIAKLMGQKGWPVEPEWWRRFPSEFGYQKGFCQFCGMCIPMERQSMADKKQLISPSFLELLNRANLPIGDYELFDKEITVEEMKAALPTWTPSCYKDEQLQEVFQHSTLDWSQYHDSRNMEGCGGI